MDSSRALSRTREREGVPTKAEGFQTENNIHPPYCLEISSWNLHILLRRDPEVLNIKKKKHPITSGPLGSLP